MTWQTDTSWDLESVFPGGPTAPAFLDALGTAEEEVETLVVQADGLGEPTRDSAWEEVVPKLEALEQRADHIYSFAACHASAHTDDSDAVGAEARAQALWSRLDRAWSAPQQHICRSDDAGVAHLLSAPGLRDMAPRIEDMRREAPLLLPPGEQELLAELSDSALHGWNQLYSHVAGRLRVKVGDGEALSQGQAHNRMESPDRAVRHETFGSMAAAWSEVSGLCVKSLSSLIHTRVVVAQRSFTPGSGPAPSSPASV